MTTWDYRVFKEPNGEYLVREVFYDDAGMIVASTEDAVAPLGDSLDELAKEIEYYKRALTLPVLTNRDLPPPDSKRNRNGRELLSRKQVEARLGLSSKDGKQSVNRARGAKRTVMTANKRKTSS